MRHFQFQSLLYSIILVFSAASIGDARPECADSVAISDRLDEMPTSFTLVATLTVEDNGAQIAKILKYFEEDEPGQPTLDTLFIFTQEGENDVFRVLGGIHTIRGFCQAGNRLGVISRQDFRVIESSV